VKKLTEHQTGGKRRQIVNIIGYTIFILIAQMFVPDFVVLGLLFNVPTEPLKLLALVGIVGTISFMAWYNYKRKQETDLIQKPSQVEIEPLIVKIQRIESELEELKKSLM